MIEPTARDLRQVERLIDAAHKEIEQECEGGFAVEIDIHTDPKTGKRWTSDIDEVRRLAHYAATASGEIRRLDTARKEALQRWDLALSSMREWRAGAVVMTVALLLHILADCIGGRP
jgi:hypothetical protein